MSIRLATFCARYILDHEASSLDALATAARDAEITQARDPLATVRATVRRDPRLIELPDGRWECGLRLLEGSVLTHRVRSSTSGRDLLFLGVEAAPLVVFLEHQPLPLVGGGEIAMPRRRSSAWAGAPVTVGPAGWLPELPAEALVGLTWSSRGLAVSAVDIDPEQSDSIESRADRVRTVLARHAQRQDRFIDTQVEFTASLARVVSSALIEVPELFGDPVAPLDEVLDLPPEPWPSGWRAHPAHPPRIDRYDLGERWVEPSDGLNDLVLGEPWDEDRAQWW